MLFLPSNLYFLYLSIHRFVEKIYNQNIFFQLSVVLPNAKTISDVKLLHKIDHYDIAILSVSLNFSLELASIGCGPEYGQEVFVLARDQKASLVTRRGEIKWLEEADFLGRNYYMFLSCNLPKVTIL